MLFVVDAVFKLYRKRYGPMAGEQKDRMQWIIGELNNEADLSREQAAYLLAQATVYSHHTFAPQRSKERYGRRGFSPIEGREVYERFARVLEVTIDVLRTKLEEPRTAYDALLAGALYGLYKTGHRLSTHVNAQHTDYYKAASIFRGHPPARELASLAIMYCAPATDPKRIDV